MLNIFLFALAVKLTSSTEPKIIEVSLTSGRSRSGSQVLDEKVHQKSSNNQN